MVIPQREYEVYQKKIRTLEAELEEMTAALTQAWDQLVPFLQDAPLLAEDAQDFAPVIHALIAAADVEVGGIYLFRSQQWFGVPDLISLSPHDLQKLQAIQSEAPTFLELSMGDTVYWGMVPILAEGGIIGALGIGTRDHTRQFTSVDTRILTRMAERVSSYITAVQLAYSREREAAHERELHIANEIQQSIQPEAAPHRPEIAMASYWLPAKEVGGDAWGWVEQPNGRLAWFILDVAGKGLPAALAAVSLHTAIRIGLRTGLSPTEVIRTVNAEFYDAYTRTNLMATAAALSLDLHTGVLELANAGHPPLLIRTQREWQRMEASVPPIGVLPHIVPETQQITLQPNDLILCYSDGFTEIQVGTKLWGESGLLETIPYGARDVNALTKHIVEISRRVGIVNDDQTLVTARYIGATGTDLL